MPFVTTQRLSKGKRSRQTVFAFIHSFYRQCILSENQNKGAVSKVYLEYIMYHHLNVYNEVQHLFKLIKKKKNFQAIWIALF